MFSDKLYNDIAKAYADMMVKFFPDYSYDYRTFESRAKNVLMFIFDNYCIVPNKTIENIITNGETISIEQLEKLFGEKVIEDIIYFMKNENKLN